MVTTIKRNHIEAIADNVIEDLDIVSYVYDHFKNYDHIFIDSETAEEISEAVYQQLKYRL